MNNILFCKIAYMKYYKGAGVDDIPYNGGSFVNENGYGHEEYNFLPRKIPDGWEDDSGEVEAGDYCLGFVETKSTNKERSNQLHIEKIRGANQIFKTEPTINGILVVWCATAYTNRASVIGWYRNATVYRDYQSFFDNYNRNAERAYNIIARASDCVLLPHQDRNANIWSVPSRKYTRIHGFGQSLIWYAQEEEANPYVEKIYNVINNYNGENDL